MAQHKQRSRLSQFKPPFLLGVAASASLLSGCGEERSLPPNDTVDGAITDGAVVDATTSSDALNTWNSCNPPICPDTPPDVGSPCGGYEEDDCYVDGQHFICDENYSWQLVPDGGASTETGSATGPTSASSVDVSEAGASTSGLPEAGATEVREAGANETTMLETAPLEAGVADTETATVATATSGTLDAGADETGMDAGALDAAVSVATSGAVQDGG